MAASFSVQVVSCFPGDAEAVRHCLPGTRGVQEAKQLLHRAFAAIAWEKDSGRAAVYISLDGAPAECNRSDGASAAGAAAVAAAAESLGYKQSSTVYVQQLQAEEGPVLQLLLQHAFVAMPHLKQVLLASALDFDADIQRQQLQQLQRQAAPSLPDAAVTLFNKAASIPGGSWLYECSRQVALPPLQVRHARVEDHDDLLPIVEAAAAGPCPSLAALPQSCSPDQPFALTRLISSQDSQNLVLVAEDEGKLVGLMVATLQLDVSLLIQAFDLGFCDAFMPAEVYAECETAAKHAAAEKAAQQAAAQGEGSPESAQPTAEQVRDELVPLLLEAFQKRQKQQKRPPKGAAPGVPHNLTAVTMLCMMSGYEDRAVDFMPALFAECPQQDYCALTLPHSAAQPQLARHMTMLRPMPGRSFPQVALLLHRAALALHMGADWEVRLAVPDDVVALHGLMGDVSNAMQLQEAFLHAVGRQGAVVAAINGEVVGMLATSPCTSEQISSLAAQFRPGMPLPCDCLEAPQQHAQVDACLISPVFAAQTGTLLAGALGLLNKQYLHYLLAPDQAAPADMLAVMMQATHRGRGGRQQAAAGSECAALFSFSKGMAHVFKHVVNAQVIIAGASETGLSCIEHLLLQPHIKFTHLTLLAPGGVNTHGVASQLTAERIARLGLHASITTVDSHMVALDTQQQLLVLADGAQLQYDLLAVTTGLQDQLGPAVAGAFPDAAQFVLSAEQLAASNITPELAAGLRSVLVYGADLHAFDVLATLIAAGVDADAITWVCPGDEQKAPSLPLLRSLAAQLGVELPEPQQGQLLDLVPTEDGTRAVAALQALDAGEDGPLQQLELDLLVGCGSLQPSAVVASCLASSYIVWDGRLVVDAQFCSSDPAVMGAGPVAKFSRRYTLPEVRHAQYNSCELGAALADALIRRFLPAKAAAAGPNAATAAAAAPAPEQHSPAAASAQAPEQAQQPDDRLPRLQQGKVVGCLLPSGQAFLCGSRPVAEASGLTLSPALPGGCALVSCSSSGDQGSSVLSISLDAAGAMQQIAFMGPAESAAAAQAVMGLVGLPFSYVAAGLGLPDGLAVTLAGWQAGAGAAPPEEQVVEGLRPGPEPGVWLVEQDVLAALQQPWAQLLLHHDFPQLRQQLLALPSGPDRAGAESDRVQQVAVEFMQSCRAQLSGYKVPGAPPAAC